ncbi:MAG: CoA-binding protein [Pelagibacteraceae bacterium]|nr:CoA-binding protein [Pelagibacteraceae bacterium]
MTYSVKDEQLIEQILASTKTIAMIGVSSIQKKETSNNIRRRPSIIVMKYLQEFGYRVIPVNPSAAGKKIYGETVVDKLENVTIPIDMVNVFRPSKEAIMIAKQTVEIGAKVLWLQYGIQNQEAQKIAKSANITYIANRCIKQEYQRLFLKVSPVFPALRT